MALREGLTNLGVLVAVFAGVGYAIFMKMKKNNPKAAEWLNKLKFGNVYEKQEENPIIDKTEQVYDEKRTMM